MAAPHPVLLDIAKGNDVPRGLHVTMDLVDSSIEHGMAPILDSQVTAQGIGGDKKALVRLVAWSLKSVALTQSANIALNTLIDVSSDVGVEPAMFKGQSIGLRWYDRPDVRPSHDIDIFVKPEHKDRLGDLAAALEPDSGVPARLAVLAEDGRVFEESVLVDDVIVDIHSNPENHILHPRDPGLMWSHTETLELPTGEAIRVLDLEASLYIALTHLFRDNFADLLHVYDVGQMMKAGPDWDIVADMAQSESWSDLIRFSLGFVSDTLEQTSPLPRDISSSSARLIELIWPDRILLKGTDSVVRSSRRQIFLPFLARGRSRDALGELTHRMFPSRRIIDLHVECRCPYPVALIRWRASQRSYLRRFRSRALDYRTHLSDTDSRRR